MQLPAEVRSEGSPVALPDLFRIRDAVVYFLLDCGEVVYVGSSIGGLRGRVLDSIAKGRAFDTIYILPVASWTVRAVELTYIRTLRPKYNTAGIEEAGKRKGRVRVGRTLLRSPDFSEWMPCPECGGELREHSGQVVCLDCPGLRAK